MKYSILAILLAAAFSFAQETAEPQKTEAPAAVPAVAQEASEPQVAEPQAAEPQVAEPQAVEAPQETAEPQAPAPQAAEAPAEAPAATPADAPAAVAAPEPTEAEDVDLSAEPEEPRRVDAGIEEKPTKQNWLLYTGIAASAWTIISLCGFSSFNDDANELYTEAETRGMSHEAYEHTRSKIKHKQKWRDIWGVQAGVSAAVVALTWIPWLVINF
ncbi:MAG: hypothetical protein IKX42_12185 [Fibrobacter sp.]|nr:hypothetical protein [Fibrobacter sp.]